MSVSRERMSAEQEVEQQLVGRETEETEERDTDTQTGEAPGEETPGIEIHPPDRPVNLDIEFDTNRHFDILSAEQKKFVLGSRCVMIIILFTVIVYISVTHESVCDRPVFLSFQPSNLTQQGETFRFGCISITAFSNVILGFELTYHILMVTYFRQQLLHHIEARMDPVFWIHNVISLPFLYALLLAKYIRLDAYTLFMSSGLVAINMLCCLLSVKLRRKADLLSFILLVPVFWTMIFVFPSVFWNTHFNVMYIAAPTFMLYVLHLVLVVSRMIVNERKSCLLNTLYNGFHVFSVVFIVGIISSTEPKRL